MAILPILILLKDLFITNTDIMIGYIYIKYTHFVIDCIYLYFYRFVFVTDIVRLYL